MTEAVATFISTLMQSHVRAHMAHLSTRSFSQHAALGAYYEGMPGLIDAYAEAFQGAHGVIESYPPPADLPAGPVELLDAVRGVVVSARLNLPQDTHLLNLLDEILTLVDSTRYKINNLY